MTNFPVIQANERGVFLRVRFTDRIHKLCPLVWLKSFLIRHPDLFLYHSTIILFLLYLLLQPAKFTLHRSYILLQTLTEIILRAKLFSPHSDPILHLRIKLLLLLQFFSLLIGFDRPYLDFLLVFFLQVC